MFRRYKKDEGAPNKLIDEVEPNTLSWTSEDRVNAMPGEPQDFEDELEDAESEEPDTRTDAERAAALQAELDREAEEFGLTGSNATALYGPNGEDVASLLDSLADIDDETAEAIADAYEAVPEAERQVAQSIVRRRHRSGEREPELWAADHAVSDWLAAMQLEGDELALYSIVADAATDAVDALVLEDDLADVDFATLYGPWSEIMDTDEGADAEGGADKAEETEPSKGSASRSKGAAPADETAEDEGEFGPNTELVVEFFSRLGTITNDQIGELVAAWREQPKEDLRVAHRNLQALADEDPRWREQLRLAQEEVFSWMNPPVDRHGGRAQAPGSRDVVGPALADAVAALCLADILEPEDAETLYAPWTAVIGEPQLPQFEDDEGDGE
jgi:hypothetical protein